MAKKTKPGTGTQDDVEDIMGSFLIAFGGGVEPLHVHRAVVRAARAAFIPKISSVVLYDPEWNTKWKSDANTVLGWMEDVGCLAAQIAMEPKDRRTVVNVDDFTTALVTVINEHKTNTAADIEARGKWCM